MRRPAPRRPAVARPTGGTETPAGRFAGTGPPGDEPPAPSGASRWRRRPPRRSLVVLVTLVTGYLLPSIDGADGPGVPTVLLTGAALLVALSDEPTTPAVRLARWGVATGAPLAALAALAGPGVLWPAAVDLWLAGIMLLAVVVVLRRVLRQPTVTLDTLFAALSAYLFGGFMFAALYGAATLLGPQPFFLQVPGASEGDLLYFSFVTLTTTGYGDLTPAQSAGRSLAVLEALAGQCFMATLVARLVSLLGPRRR